MFAIELADSFLKGESTDEQVNQLPLLVLRDILMILAIVQELFLIETFATFATIVLL